VSERNSENEHEPPARRGCRQLPARFSRREAVSWLGFQDEEFGDLPIYPVIANQSGGQPKKAGNNSRPK